MEPTVSITGSLQIKTGDDTLNITGTGISANGVLTIGTPTQSTFSTTGVSNMVVFNPSDWYSLRVQKLDPNAKTPTKAHTTDLGLDLYALEDTELVPGKVTKVRTGIACGFPKGYGALIRDRSSVATKQELFVVAGVIDQEYIGEIIVAMFNPIQSAQIDLFRDVVLTTKYIKAGDKIAQMILTPIYNCPIVEVESLENTTRGNNGFGSSGS